MNQTLKSLVGKAARKVTDAASVAGYRLNQLKYSTKVPDLSPLGDRIVGEVREEGVSVVPLKSLMFSANDAFLDAAKRAANEPDAFATDSIEYTQGFKHCVPINPSTIAKEYPALYMWGLDHGLLDIIENCIGLPIAYHGVILRKELVDQRVIATRLWHKDGEDRNIIRVTVYLNDVLDAESGPFEYVPRKWNLSYRAFKGLDTISDEQMRQVVPSSEWRTCTGPAGTVIFSATAKIFHHGKMPQKERIAASYVYTSRNPTNEELCQTYSFRTGIPYITTPLAGRQRECLWKYQAYLPGETR